MAAQVDAVKVETKAGNNVLLGAASCWRMDDTSPVMLYRGPFEAKLSSLAAPVAPEEPGWGVALMFAASADKVGVGPAVLLPSFRVFGMEVDASAGFAAGSRGFVAATAQAGVRFPR